MLPRRSWRHPGSTLLGGASLVVQAECFSMGLAFAEEHGTWPHDLLCFGQHVEGLSPGGTGFTTGSQARLKVGPEDGQVEQVQLQALLQVGWQVCFGTIGNQS